MAVKKLVKIWDDENLLTDNIDFLLQKTKKVQFPLNQHSKQIITDLIDTFQATPCAGIAANQIRYDRSIFIGLKNIDDEDRAQRLEEMESSLDEDEENQENEEKDNFEIYINPEILRVKEDSTQEEEEGCLSIPNLQLEVKRFDKIMVRYFTQEGRSIKKPINKFMSKLFQHELDHLNGELMLNNLQNISGIAIAQHLPAEKIKKLDMLLVEYIEKYDKHIIKR